MPGSKMSASEYSTYIRFSSDKHLLVEGKTDRILFLLLYDEITGRRGQKLTCGRAVIDTAEDLLEPSGVGNREKVEEVCKSVSLTSYGDKLVGFADREFREFGQNNELRDLLASHYVIGRLVWSRGHSVENYVFDFDTLREAARDLSPTPHFADALQRFEAVFEPTVRLGCALSLMADELQLLNRIKASITWQCLAITDNEVSLDHARWAITLAQRQGLSPAQLDSVLNRLDVWRKIVDVADFRVVRWMCHGHLGFAILWATYARCVVEACRHDNVVNPDVEASRVLHSSESDRFHACASWWARKALGGQGSYPIEVFGLLGEDTSRFRQNAPVAALSGAD